VAALRDGVKEPGARAGARPRALQLGRRAVTLRVYGVDAPLDSTDRLPCLFHVGIAIFCAFASSATTKAHEARELRTNRNLFGVLRPNDQVRRYALSRLTSRIAAS